MLECLAVVLAATRSGVLQRTQAYKFRPNFARNSAFFSCESVLDATDFAGLQPSATCAR
jgi:hypothetical protein